MNEQLASDPTGARMGGMTRRGFLRWTSMVGAALAGGCNAPKTARRSLYRPHIVMYLSDDHGIDFVGCYGNEVIRTPNIDALAREGMRFTRMFAASPTCAPSRSVLYTGLYPARNGTMKNHTICRDDIQSLPTYLKALGYRVVLADKLHVKPPEVFDFEYIKATLPPDPEQKRVYRAEGLDLDPVERLLASHRSEHPDQPLCLILGDDSPHVIWERNKTYDPAALPMPPFMVDTPKTRKALANYYQDITTMDNRIGRAVELLKQYGLWDRTLFIYTTDQGSEWPKSKWTLYDAGLRVPFVAVWPGVLEPGATCEAMVSFVDVTPTFIDLAGGTAPQGLDGRSLASLLTEPHEPFRDRVFASHSGDGDKNIFPQRAVRTPRYKYVLNLHPENTWTTHFTLVGGIPDSHKEVWDTWIEKARVDAPTARLVDIIQHHPPEELYDLANDPYELNNVAGDARYAEVLTRLRGDLAAWRKAQNDPDE